MVQTAKKLLRLARIRPIVLAIMLLTTSILTSGMAANAAGLSGSEKTVIEVYNDMAKLEFTNKPFIENGEIYLPLRETLNQFGITGIRWDNDKIDIALPLLDNYQGGARQESQCRIAIGTAKIWYGGQADANGYTLRYAPVVRDGITYATVELFEDLASRGQMLWFRTRFKQSANPEDYISEGEEVFIGTGEEQDKYRPVDENGNKRYVKRIVINEKGEAMYVVTAENQRPEKIASISSLNSASMKGYTPGAEGRSRTFYINAQGTEILYSSGIFVYERTQEDEFVKIAYIPPALQINCCAYNQFKLLN